jgi:hypothetical protein
MSLSQSLNIVGTGGGINNRNNSNTQSNGTNGTKSNHQRQNNTIEST